MSIELRKSAIFCCSDNVGNLIKTLKSVKNTIVRRVKYLKNIIGFSNYLDPVTNPDGDEDKMDEVDKEEKEENKDEKNPYEQYNNYIKIYNELLEIFLDSNQNQPDFDTLEVLHTSSQIRLLSGVVSN